MRVKDQQIDLPKDPHEGKRFCWHHWVWLGPEWELHGAKSLYQRAVCEKCQKEKTKPR